MAELKQYAAEPMAEVPEMKELIDKKIKEMAELKPCDCRNTELDIFTQTDWDGETEWVIMCQKCKTLASGSSKEKAIHAWNKRS